LLTSGTPFPNITLLGQILSEDELSDLLAKLHELISAEEFDETYFDRLAKTMSGSPTASDESWGSNVVTNNYEVM
jgi:hypothetical protein